MKILVIGGGNTGLALANILSENHDVTLIEKSKEKARKVANKTTALVIKGDASDISILKEAGIKETDSLIVTTEDDKTNLMICTIAKSEEVEKIIALVNKPINEELFTKLGITRLVSVVSTNVTGITGMLYQYGDERIIAQFGEGDMQIVELMIAKDSKLIGQKARIENATIAAIYRSGDLLIPKENTNLEEGDVLLVAVKTKDLKNIANLIAGK